MNNRLNNEQKLDEVYTIIKLQESRAMRARWFNAIKWIIILGITYFIATNPIFIIEKVTTIMRPLIIANIKNLVDEEKSGMLEEMKAYLHEKTAPTDE